MTPIEKLVKSMLGEDCEDFSFSVGGAIRTGWRKYLLEKPFALGDSEASEMVEQSWRALHDRDIRLFVGPGVFRIGPNEYADSYPPSSKPRGCSQVFALPGVPVLDLVEFCDVGSHGQESWRAVQKSLSKIMRVAPFAIQFADSAGLCASFLQPVTSREAQQIGRFILEVNPEAMDLPPQHLEALGLPVPMDRKYPNEPDYEAAMIKYVTAVGKFRMWWD